MPRYLGILILLFPISVSAKSICESLSSLSAQVNYCDENMAYVPAAKNCFKKYKELVDSENAKIKAVLNKDVKNAKGSEQQADFQTTETVLKSAIKTLDNLLAQGKQTYNEIDAFSEDMVLPIYEAYPEDYELDPKSAQGQKIFREKECYGEPMEDLDKIKTELKDIISDLEKTKAKSSSLQKISNFKEGNLDSLNAIVPKATKNKSSEPMPTGKSKKGNSTITGIEESKKKNKKLPD